MDRPMDRLKIGVASEHQTPKQPSADAVNTPGLILGAQLALVCGLTYSLVATLPRLEAILLAYAHTDISILEQAVSRDPQAPHLRYRLGTAYTERGREGDLNRGITEIEEAARLNPYRWTYLEELADLYEAAGEHKSAETTLRNELEFNPRDPEAHWLLGSLLLRTGRTAEALPMFEVAAAGGAPLLRLVLAELAESGLDAQDISTVVPDDGPSAREFLVFVRQREIDDVAVERLDEFWHRFLEDPGPTSMKQDFYLQSLIRRGEAQAARRVWSELGTAVGLSDSQYAGGDLIWNGDFENPVSGAPLDWTPGRGGFTFSLEETQGETQTGSNTVATGTGQAALVNFDGKDTCDRLLIQRPMVDRARPLPTESALQVPLLRTQITASKSESGQQREAPNSPISICQQTLRRGSRLELASRYPWAVNRLALEFRCRPVDEQQTYSGALWIDRVQLRPVRP